MSKKAVRRIGIAADIMMYAVMLLQMLYVFTGNTLHEITGIVFFICLAVHIVIKRKHIKTLFVRGSKQPARRVSDIIIILLLILSAAMAVSSMGVSRTIFPWFSAVGSSTLHKYLASALLTLAVLHGGMYFCIRTKKKKRACIIIGLCCCAAAAFGLALVPYLNRHFKEVRVDTVSAVSGERLGVYGDSVLTVYFTRVGNTDFEPGVDAVSGASLMIADGELTGSNKLIADMVSDILGCGESAVTLTGERYPSSYGDTVSVAGKELGSKARPAVESIDVSGCDTVILVYPLWWGTVPMPVASFLEQTDLSGKKLFVIATQGSSGYGKSISDIKELAKGAEVTEVMSIYCDDIPSARESIYSRLKELGF